MILSLVLGLSSCSVNAQQSGNEYSKDKTYHVSRVDGKYNQNTSSDEMRGIWVSQFDMHYIYRDGSKQRDVEDYTSKVQAMIENLKRDGFNTIFLQIRPNGDSMYVSDVYPASKYIAGVYGGNIEYDAIEIYLEIAKKAGFEVHAWINPFRLCSKDELVSYRSGVLYRWFLEGIGKRIEQGDDGILYLDPAYEDATELIVSGASEILRKYDFDGIHLDDYFYPTGFEFEDDVEFSKSGFDDKGDFRRNNIDRTVKALYEAVHGHGKVFGISPAGNIYSLASGWYIDVYKWCSEEGFVDYILPQLYFGFDNAVCPFDKILADWCNAVKNENVRLYIGLSASKCVMGSEGKVDVFAGEKGKYEWRDNKDILARSMTLIRDKKAADGVCIFTYSSFYDPITGNENAGALEEKEAFCEIITK